MSKPAKQIRINIGESDTGMGAPGLTPEGNEAEGLQFQAVGIYRSAHNPKEYVCGIFTIRNGVVIKTQLEDPTLYQIAAMTGKTYFSRLFLSGQITEV